jgi:hypothetical protein
MKKPALIEIDAQRHRVEFARPLNLCQSVIETRVGDKMLRQTPMKRSELLNTP